MASSYGNLVGDQWVNEVTARAAKHGHHTQVQKRDQPLRVGGVAKTTEEAGQNVKVPIAFARTDGRIEGGTYTAPMLPSSGCPALLGLQSLEAMGAVLDCAAKKLYVRGSRDQDVTVQLPPGGQCYDLLQADSGHLLLPITRYQQAARQAAD
eukprot:4268155-Amphidinium_carterae.2